MVSAQAGVVLGGERQLCGDDRLSLSHPYYLGLRLALRLACRGAPAVSSGHHNLVVVALHRGYCGTKVAVGHEARLWLAMCPGGAWNPTPGALAEDAVTSSGRVAEDGIQPPLSSLAAGDREDQRQASHPAARAALAVTASGCPVLAVSRSKRKLTAAWRCPSPERSSYAYRALAALLPASQCSPAEAARVSAQVMVQRSAHVL